MIKIDPQELKGSRIYFTGFDKYSFNEKLSKEEKIKKIEKTLKVLLLTKNKIVFGASHLRSDLAKYIITKYPEIFEKKLLLPALRNDHKGDLSKAVGTNEPMLKIFDTYIGWNLEDNTTWFRNKILEGFKLEKSILRLNLRHTSNENIKQIIKALEEREYFDREISEEIIPKLITNKEDLYNFRKYQKLIYNLSGARVVNCHSALDQENMLFDYSLSDLEERKTYLNEVEIFHRIFIEQVFVVLERAKKDFFDRLSIKDILQLRNKIEESTFIEKYNELINKSVKLVQKKDAIDLYSLREILELAEFIKKNFYDEINKELDFYIKNKNKNILKNTIIAPSSKLIISNLPFIGNIISNTIDLTKILISSISYAITNLNNDNLNNKKKLFSMQQELANKIIKKADINNKSELIDTLKLLKSYYDEKYENF